MSWTPEGELELLLLKVMTRSREDSLYEFSATRKRIERQEAAKGRMGGPVASGCIAAAGEAVKQFANAAVRDAVPILESGGALQRESTAWLRATISQSVDAMVSGLGNQIDSMKTTGGFRGRRAELRRVARAAARVRAVWIRARRLHQRALSDA